MKPTLDEYKSYIRELKLRMKQLALKNKELSKLVAQTRVNNFVGENKNGINSTELIKAHKNVVHIQKNVRGFLARKLYKDLLTNNINEKMPQITASKETSSDQNMPSQMMIAQKIMRKFEESLMKKNITPEMVFRMVDEEQTNSVQINKLGLFLKTLDLGLKQSQIQRILYILDEECLGSVSQKDYLMVLSAFEITKEISTNKKLFSGEFGDRTLPQIILIKFGALLLHNNITVNSFIKKVFGDQNFGFRK
jgi:hypothetical protein